MCPPGGSCLAPPGDLLDLLARRLLRDPERLQRLGCYPAVLTDEAEQDVLGADVVVAEHPGLVLGQDHDAARPVGEPVEHAQRRLPRVGFFAAADKNTIHLVCGMGIAERPAISAIKRKGHRTARGRYPG